MVYGPRFVGYGGWLANFGFFFFFFFPSPICGFELLVEC